MPHCSAGCLQACPTVLLVVFRHSSLSCMVTLYKKINCRARNSFKSLHQQCQRCYMGPDPWDVIYGKCGWSSKRITRKHELLTYRNCNSHKHTRCQINMRSIIMYMRRAQSGTETKLRFYYICKGYTHVWHSDKAWSQLLTTTIYAASTWRLAWVHSIHTSWLQFKQPLYLRNSLNNKACHMWGHLHQRLLFSYSEKDCSYYH